MLSITSPNLESKAAQAAVTAAAAALTTYIRPARFPRWVRRGVSMSNTLASVGMAMAGNRKPEASRLTGGSGDTVEMVDGKPVSKPATTLLSASSAGMALVTSGIAMRIDKRVEKALVKRGVAHPRLWMAAGAAVVSLAGPWVTEQIQKSTAKLQEKQLTKETLTSTLENPLGRDDQRSTNKNAQIEAGDPSRHVVSDQADAGQGDEDAKS